MKKILFLFAALFAFVSCDMLSSQLGGGSDEDDDAVAVKMDIERLYATSREGTVSILFQASSSNNISFKNVGEDAEWLSDGMVIPASQKGIYIDPDPENPDMSYYVAEFDFDENSSDMARPSKIEFKTPTETKEILVAQAGANKLIGMEVDASIQDYTLLKRSNMWSIKKGNEDEVAQLLSHINDIKQFIGVNMLVPTSSIPDMKWLTFFYSSQISEFSTQMFYDCQYLEELALPGVQKIKDLFSFEAIPKLKKLTLSIYSRRLVADMPGFSHSQDGNVVESYKNIDLVLGTETGVVVDGMMINVPNEDPYSDLAHFSFGPFKSINGVEGAKSKGPFYVNSLPVDANQIEGDTIVILDEEIGADGFAKVHEMLVRSAQEQGARKFDLEFPNLTRILTEEAFKYLENIRSVTAPLLEDVPVSTFERCFNLQSVDFPQLFGIGENGFDGCTSLQSVSFPKLHYIDNNAFSDCSSLVDITIATESDYLNCEEHSFSGLEHNKVALKTSNIETSGLFLLVKYTPSYSHSLSTKEVGPFKQLNDINSSQIVSGVMSLGTMPIYGSLIEGDEWVIDDSEVITGGIKPSGNPGDMWRLVAALNSAGRDIKVTFPNLKAIPSWAFIYSTVESDGFTHKLGADNLYSIDAPMADSIGDYAFIRCADLNLVSIAKAQTIGTSAFDQSSIHQAVYPEVTTIREGAFSNCSNLRAVSFPKVTLLPWGSFTDTNITDVNDTQFPALTTIDDGAFRYSDALKTISLSNVTHIGYAAFEQCTSLKSITFPRVKSIESSKHREDGAFFMCKSLTDVSMDSIEVVGRSAFDSCNALTSIDFPCATKLEPTAFISCRLLKDVSLPKLTSCKDSAFEGCGSIEEISLPGVETLCDRVFAGCDALKKGDFPDVDLINSEVFDGCLYLEELTIATKGQFMSALSDAFDGVDVSRITLTTNGLGLFVEIRNNTWYLKFDNSPPPLEFKRIIRYNDIL